MNAQFTVGEFAKICGVSKQTLIFYDRENVLKPKFINPNNGYRYYTADQLEQMDSIMILREMGFSLSEIREHMQNRTPENSLQMLERQKLSLKSKIEDLMTIEKRISRKMESLEMFYNQDNSFKIKTMPSQLLAVQKVKSPYGLLSVDMALKSLMKKARSGSMGHFYQVGDIVPFENLKKENFLSFTYAFFPVEGYDENTDIIEKKEGLYALKLHFGPYETMGNTYKEMLSLIEKEGLRVAGDSYEFCVLDSLTSSSPSKYCTQIQIPVK